MIKKNLQKQKKPLIIQAINELLINSHEKQEGIWILI